MDLQTLLHHEIELLKKVLIVVDNETDPEFHIQALLDDKLAELEKVSNPTRIFDYAGHEILAGDDDGDFDFPIDEEINQ